MRTDFGATGISEESANAVAIDAKSRIVLGGYGSDDFALARYVGDATVSLAPVVSIDSGPTNGATITDPSPTFGFSSDEDPGVSFECGLDGASWSACSGPGNTHTTAELADGSYTFYVRGSDRAGNVSVPVSRTFTVAVPQPPDLDPPETTITKHPRKKVTTSKTKVKAKFKFQADEEATFECKRDKKAWKSCSSPKTYKVKPGKHVFRVRATDKAGNLDATPAKWKWKVRRR